MSSPLIRIELPNIDHLPMEMNDCLNSIELELIAAVTSLERRYSKFKFEIAKTAAPRSIAIPSGDPRKAAEDLHLDLDHVADPSHASYQ